MLKISRTVMIDDDAITIEVLYDKDGLAIKKQHNLLAVEMLEFTLQEAEILYDLMKLARPTKDDGTEY